MVAGRGRDVLGVAAAEAAAGKMADGKAGEEKPEKPQRAGAAGGEHNPSVAGCVGCSGPFFERPGVGGIGWGRKWADLALTRPGAGPRRDPGTPGAARWDPGPHRLLAGGEPTTVGHLLAPAEALLPMRREMGTREGYRTRGGTRSGSAGAATATPETHITQNTRTHTGRVTERWPQALATGRVSNGAGL